MKKVMILFLIAILMAATGCSKNNEAEEPKNEAAQDISDENSRYGGSLVVATKGCPPHIDSDKSTLWTITETMNHVYEGLFEFDKNQISTPFLAKSYELVNDNKTYAVNLRKGVLFHNGKEMTTADVEASFNRWLKINAGGQMVDEYLEKIDVTGPYGISFTFKKPYAPFLNILASEVSGQKFYVKTKEMIDKYGDNIIQEHIGTGVYMLSEFIPDQHLKLKRFDKYVPDKGESSLFAGKRIAYIDDITIKYVKDPMVRVAGIQTGKFQFAEEIPQDQYSLFENNPDIEIVDLDNDMMGMLAINSGKAPFNNINARKAVINALDMEELGRVTIGNEKFWSIKGGGSMFPKSSVWYDPDSGKGIHNHQDIEKAKNYLGKSNYDGTPIVIINTKEDMVQSQAAMGLKSQLEKAGFIVDIQLYDKATVFEKLFEKNPKWDLHFSTWVEASPDPQVFGAWIGTNRWISNWDDSESIKMDNIFKRMMTETDFDKRYKIVKQWNKEVWNKVPIIKTFNYSRVHLISSKLKGYNNYCKQIYWNTWIEK